jgi:hypothetical protein
LLLLLSLTHSAVYNDYYIQQLDGKDFKDNNLPCDIKIEFEGVGFDRKMTVNVKELGKVVKTHTFEDVYWVGLGFFNGYSQLAVNNGISNILYAKKKVVESIDDFKGLIEGEEWVYRRTQKGYHKVETNVIDLKQLGFTSKWSISEGNSETLVNTSVKIEFNSSGSFLKVGTGDVQEITGLVWTTREKTKAVTLTLRTADGTRLLASNPKNDYDILVDRINEHWKLRKTIEKDFLRRRSKPIKIIQ